MNLDGVSRRNFMKAAALGAVSVSVAGGLAACAIDERGFLG